MNAFWYTQISHECCVVHAGVEDLELMGECCGVLVKGVAASDAEEANFRRVVSLIKLSQLNVCLSPCVCKCAC